MQWTGELPRCSRFIGFKCKFFNKQDNYYRFMFAFFRLVKTLKYKHSHIAVMSIGLILTSFAVASPAFANQCVVNLYGNKKSDDCSSSISLRNDFGKVLFLGKFRSESPVRTESISYSLNKTLTEFGPDAPAKITKTCSLDQIENLRVEFPGHTMFNDDADVLLSFEIEGKAARHYLAKNTTNMFEVLLSGNDIDHSGMREFDKTRHVNITTTDADGEKLSAKFKMQDIYCN